MSNKEIVIEAIRQLPEQVSFEEIAEEVAILAALRLSGTRGADAKPALAPPPKGELGRGSTPSQTP